MTAPSAPPPRLLRLKQWLYCTVVRLLRRTLRLSVHTVRLSFGPLTYLDNRYRERPTLLLVHGLATDKDSWLPLARHLRRQYHLLIPDLPGHGDSIRSPSLRYDIPSQAQRLGELLDHLKVDGVHLVGSSMGGAIACELATQRAGHIASLTLIDSFGLEVTDSPVRRFIRENGYNPLLYADNREEYRRKMQSNMGRPPRLPGFALDVLSYRLVINRALNTRIFNDIDGNDQSPNLPQITAPTLVLWGEADTVLHPDDAEAFVAQLPHGEKRLLPGVGHAAMIEVPGTVARHISDFLGKICR